MKKLYSRADMNYRVVNNNGLLIARAFMQDPKIVLADEPIASLDPLTTESVMDDLKRLNEEFHITVIVNLHSGVFGQRFVDRIIGLRDGELVYDEPISKVTEKDLEAIYQPVSIVKKSEVQA